MPTGWPRGIAFTYDFDTAHGPQPNTVTLYLTPRLAAFEALTPDGWASAAGAWTDWRDALAAQGVRAIARTNLVRTQDGGVSDAVLDATSLDALRELAARMAAWLADPTLMFPAEPMALTTSVPRPGTITAASVFPIAVGLVVEIPAVEQAQALRPTAQGGPRGEPTRVFAAAEATATPAGGGTVDVATFGGHFASAFPALTFALGRVSPDADGNSDDSVASAWAVQRALLSPTIANGTLYAAPAPIANTLCSGTISLPPVPAALQAVAWPDVYALAGVDLDAVARVLAGAVDTMLAAPLVASLAERAADAHATFARSRRRLAQRYAARQVQWICGPQAPCSGSPSQLDAARRAFEAELGAGLTSAYRFDTAVQCVVSWDSPLSGTGGDRFTLRGVMRPAGTASLPGGVVVSQGSLPVPASGGTTLTFLTGIAGDDSATGVALDLEFDVISIQCAAADGTPSIEVTPVDPYRGGAARPRVGPPGTVTRVPIVPRDYPSPPTIISTDALESTVPTWELHCVYGGEVTSHDRIVAAVEYNTPVAPGGDTPTAAASDAPAPSSLLEPFGRFLVVHKLLRSIVASPSVVAGFSRPENPAEPQWIAAVRMLATLAGDVADSAGWSEAGSSEAGSSEAGSSEPTVAGDEAVPAIDAYTITDLPSTDAARQIVVSWAGEESSATGATVALAALDPATLAPYANQIEQRASRSLVIGYSPGPTTDSRWRAHDLAIRHLHPLACEQAVVSVWLQRNAGSVAAADGTRWDIREAFRYTTTPVRPPEPVAVLVDSHEPVAVAALPIRQSGLCQSLSAPTARALCDRIFTMLCWLVPTPGTPPVHTVTERKLTIACGFTYPLAIIDGADGPFSPLMPILSGQSVPLDTSDPARLAEVASVCASAIAAWAEANDVSFGAGARPGARLVFDIGFAAAYASTGAQVLRMRDLRLSLGS